MRRLFRKIIELAEDDGFASFQNQIVSNFYDSLDTGYKSNYNEIELVEELVKAANGQRYGPISIFAKMLHGSRSYVKFNYLNQPVSKELGDMAVISLVTYKNKRILQRICIIQNKKASGNGWRIDVKQLFLLKNFPPFSGNKGIFRGNKDLTFRNSSGCFGAFGLLEAPGEMIFIAAPLVSDFLRGKKTLRRSDISIPSDSQHSEGAIWGFHFLPLFLRYDIFLIEEVLQRYKYSYILFKNILAQKIFANTKFCRDLYEFTRAWTQFNIGEITCFHNNVVNRTADAFSNFLIKSADYRDFPIPEGDNMFGEKEFDGQMAIFIIHLDLNLLEELSMP